jgi:hypothetical protein
MSASMRAPLTSAALRAVLDLPALPDAACRARAPLHDLDISGETAAERHARHRTAARVCRAHCADLDACAALLPHLPTGSEGVLAGWLLDGHHPPQPIADTDNDEHDEDTAGEGRCDHDTDAGVAAWARAPRAGGPPLGPLGVGRPEGGRAGAVSPGV